MLCGTTFVGLRGQTLFHENAITFSANNAGTRLGYWALRPFPSPSVVHLPGRLLPGFHHPRLSKSACPVLSPRQRFSNMKPQRGRFVKRGRKKFYTLPFR